MHNYQQLNIKSKNKNKLSKRPEQEQNYRYEDHLEGYQLGRGRGRRVGKEQGLRNTICRYKMDRRC